MLSPKQYPKEKYNLFMKKQVGLMPLYAFLGAHILLGIHGIRKHRKAWNTAIAQVLYRLHDLITCQIFELIGTFIRLVTSQEESESSVDPFESPSSG